MKTNQKKDMVDVLISDNEKLNSDLKNCVYNLDKLSEKGLDHWVSDEGFWWNSSTNQISINKPQSIPDVPKELAFQNKSQEATIKHASKENTSNRKGFLRISIDKWLKTGKEQKKEKQP